MPKNRPPFDTALDEFRAPTPAQKLEEIKKTGPPTEGYGTPTPPTGDYGYTTGFKGKKPRKTLDEKYPGVAGSLAARDAKTQKLFDRAVTSIEEAKAADRPPKTEAQQWASAIEAAFSPQTFARRERMEELKHQGLLAQLEHNANIMEMAARMGANRPLTDEQERYQREQAQEDQFQAQARAAGYDDYETMQAEQLRMKMEEHDSVVAYRKAQSEYNKAMADRARSLDNSKEMNGIATLFEADLAAYDSQWAKLWAIRYPKDNMYAWDEYTDEYKAKWMRQAEAVHKGQQRVQKQFRTAYRKRLKDIGVETGTLGDIPPPDEPFFMAVPPEIKKQEEDEGPGWFKRTWDHMTTSPTERERQGLPPSHGGSVSHTYGGEPAEEPDSGGAGPSDITRAPLTNPEDERLMPKATDVDRLWELSQKHGEAEGFRLYLEELESGTPAQP